MSEIHHNQQRQIELESNQDEHCTIATAAIILNNIDGIYEAVKVNASTLSVGYNLAKVSLEMIEGLLIELGYRLDNNLVNKSKRALFYYVEETHRINNNLSDDSYIKLDPGKLLQKYQSQRGENDTTDLGHWKKYL